MTETVVLELTSEQANWVRDAVAEKRERTPDDSEHYDPSEIAAILDKAEQLLNDAIDGRSVGQGLVKLARAGCTPAEAVDYYMVEHRDMTQSDWADERNADQSTVSENVSKASAKLDK